IPRFAPEVRSANLDLVREIAKIGQKKGATPAQMALAWLLAQKPWIVPIPGTRRLERLKENIGAVDVKLTADDLVAIAGVLSKVTVKGDRYPSSLSEMTGR
ncbi:MAG: aldo/keto reductase, partial [Firmicutes bacterium]|nr:aldo/keto reductase [Bacillota bacterium]